LHVSIHSKARRAGANRRVAQTHLVPDLDETRSFIDDHRHGVFAVLVLEPFGEVQRALSSAPVVMWLDDEGGIKGETNDLSARLFVDSKREDDCAGRLEFARFKEELDRGAEEKSVSSLCIVRVSQSLITHSAPIVPDLSSLEPRPQISPVDSSYSPPKGSWVHCPLVALRTGTTSEVSGVFYLLYGGEAIPTLVSHEQEGLERGIRALPFEDQGMSHHPGSGQVLVSVIP
jgi:hypothetical protein